MKEQVFFVIDGKELLLDKVLVEFDETPLFFVCKREQNYFISSCVDVEQERYLVAQVGLGNLSKMLHGKITMRDFILTAQLFWEITAGEEIAKDSVIKKTVETICLDELPYEGAYLTLATKDLERYMEKIDAILYGSEDWEPKSHELSSMYIEEYIKTFNAQYAVTIQNIYESIIANVYKRELKNNNQERGFSKEVCKEGVTVDANRMDLKVEVKTNDNLPWAA